MSIRYAIEGDLRFISHHDTIRMFERALARAGIPVRRSAGFNPRPRLTFLLPRSVGIASLDERLELELAEEMAADEAYRRLAAQMPEGIRLLSVEPVNAAARRRPTTVAYRLPLDQTLVERLREPTDRFLAADSHRVDRAGQPGDRPRVIDVRGFVSAMALGPDELTWVQTVGPVGSARPAEVLAALGLAPTDHLHRLVRTGVGFDDPSSARMSRPEEADPARSLGKDSSSVQEP